MQVHLCYAAPARQMNEELPKNEESIFALQTERVKESRGCTRNRPRRYVSASAIILWLLLATASLHLWLLRLLGVIELPF